MKVFQSISNKNPDIPQTFGNFTFVNQSNPDRVEVLEDGIWKATFTKDCRTVHLKGKKRTFTEFSKTIQDSFVRTRATSWGAAQEGGRWSPTGGDRDSSMSVSGGYGRMVCENLNQSRRHSLINIVKNIDGTYKFNSNKPARGSSQLTGLMFAYQASDGLNNHYFARCLFTSTDIQDTFNRTEVDQWGSTNAGWSWSNLGGSASDYLVENNIGKQILTSTNSSRRNILYSITPDDFDVTVAIQKKTLSVDGSVFARILARYVDISNHYLFRLRFSPQFTPANKLYVSIQKNVAGSFSSIGSEVETAFTHDINKKYILRAKGEGQDLKIKVWEEGTTEPVNWDLEVTDSEFTTGAIGLTSLATSSNTETNPEVEYSNVFIIQENESKDRVRLALQKRVAGSYSDIISNFDVPNLFRNDEAEEFKMRVSHDEGGDIKVKVWKALEIEPATWNIETNDTTYLEGRVGLRCQLFDGVTNNPVEFAYTDVEYANEWSANPVVEHDIWVRVLDAPFSGNQSDIDVEWVKSQLLNESDDLLAVAMRYINNQINVETSNFDALFARDLDPVLTPRQDNYPGVDNSTRVFTGSANYNGLNSLGSRPVGADFNDYLWCTATYPGETDQPDNNQFRCLDCSGYIRMIFGWHFGFGMTRGTPNGVDVPRLADQQTKLGPGVFIMDRVSLGTPPATMPPEILPGDILGFEANTGQVFEFDEEAGEFVQVGEEGPEDIENRVSHVAIYLGLDVNGLHRFISSRMSANGPTISDLAGNSTVVSGDNLYSKMFRIIRRY